MPACVPAERGRALRRAAVTVTCGAGVSASGAPIQRTTSPLL